MSEFVFVYGVRKCSSFILLQVVDQISQHHLLKRFVFSPLYIFASFVKDKVSIGAWIYLWAFYFVPSIYISVFVPVPHCVDDCEVRQVDSSSSILLSQDCFGYLRFFVFPYKLWNYLFQFFTVNNFTCVTLSTYLKDMIDFRVSAHMENGGFFLPLGLVILNTNRIVLSHSIVKKG